MTFEFKRYWVTGNRWEFKRIIRLCMGNKILSIMDGMTAISENAQNGKINPKTHKNTPEVSQFYSFYWMKVKFSVF